jgi:hypothetical protein
LRNLVSFGQIRIKIIFAGVFIKSFYLAAKSQTHTNGFFDSFLIMLRQSTGMAQTYSADIRIGMIAIFSTVGTKGFAFGKQLGMDFEPYYNFVFGVHV